MNLWMKGEPDREIFTALAPNDRRAKPYTEYAL